MIASPAGTVFALFLAAAMVVLVVGVVVDCVMTFRDWHRRTAARRWARPPRPRGLP